MSEIERIADQLSRAFDGDAWFGPGLRPILSEVTQAEATARILPGVHTICEIVLHMAAWKNAVIDGLEGRPVNVDPQDNFPTFPSWSRAVALLESAHRDLLEAVAKLDPDHLDDPMPGQDYSVYFALHGTIQHDTYHAGQILVLHRAAMDSTSAA